MTKSNGFKWSDTDCVFTKASPICERNINIEKEEQERRAKLDAEEAERLRLLKETEAKRLAKLEAE